jgi:hypothetical protein
MSTGPTPYNPTIDNPVSRTVSTKTYYYDSFGNTLYDVSYQNRLNYIVSSGNTYTAPFFSAGLNGNYFELAARSGITLSDPAYTDIEIMKLLPKEKRAIQPFAYNGSRLWLFAEDATILLGNGMTMFGITGGAFVKPNSYLGFWPDFGISYTSEYVRQVAESMSQQGATLQYIMIDQEGEEVYFKDENGNISSPLVNCVTGGTFYTSGWRGLSSWLDYYLFEGGNTSYNFLGDSAEASTNRIAWLAAWNRYKNKAFEQAFLPELLNYNSDSAVSNYNDWITLPKTTYNSFNYLGEYASPESLENRAISGNAQSPVIYGWFTNGPLVEQLNYDFSQDTPAVSALDPTVIFNRTFSYKNSLLDKFFTSGPWSSFISVVSEMKEAKRNAPNSPITPWIPSVMQAGQYNLNYGSIYKYEAPWLKSNTQMPAVAAHNRWRFRNISSETSGFSGPLSSTGGIRIVSGTTSAVKSLYYVYNGLTSGITYVFSYYVNLGCGYTGFAAGFNNYTKNNYGIPTGITYYQSLPSATGPFYNTGPIYYPPGTSDWTKVEFKFNLPSPDPKNDDIFNPTLEVSVIDESTTSGLTLTMFIADPSFEIESSPSNISVISMTPIVSEQNKIQVSKWSPCGFADVKIGYNPKLALYLTDRAGNSAYFYEMIRHCCLLGTKAFGWFNAFSFIDNSYPGAINIGFAGQDALGAAKQNLTLTNGFTGFLDEYKLLNETLHDVHQKIGGFTLTTAGATDKWNWSLPYFASAAPDTRGQTWWWRITAQNGYTLYVNGMTLPDANGSVGMWFGTTGPTLAGVSITSTQPIPPSEPTGITAVRDFNFLQMNSLADLTGNSLSFSRGGTASYIGPSGYLLFAGSNVPRFHYDPVTLTKRGLLIEASVANQLNWSESFASTGGIQNNWIYTNLVGVSGNTSPSLDLSAIRFTATGANATLISSSAVGNTTNPKILSFWCKGITGTESLSYTVDGGTLWNSVSKLSGSWNRVYFGPIFNGNCYFGHRVGFRLGNTNDSVMIWGAQLENSKTGTNPNDLVRTENPDMYGFNQETSYIKTESTTVTRSADSLAFVGATTWIGATYGTLLIEEENMNFNSGGRFTIFGFTAASSTIPGNHWIGPRTDSFLYQSGDGSVNRSNGFSWCYKNRYHARDTQHKWFFSWSPYGYKWGANSRIKSIAQNITPLTIISSFNFPNEGTMVRVRYFDKVFSNDITRQFALGGVTQIGWLNNGDGIVPPSTDYP